MVARAPTGRWPDFAPRAVAAGVHSVHAFPMWLREKVIGALNVFGEGPLPLDAGDAKLVQALADIATISIIQERAVAHAEMLTEQLQGALNTRVVRRAGKGSDLADARRERRYRLRAAPLARAPQPSAHRDPGPRHRHRGRRSAAP